LEGIFAYAAPRMRLMRKLPSMDPNLVEDVEFPDFVEAMKKLQEDDNKQFQLRFPTVESKNVMRTCSFDEDVTKGCPLPRLQKRIEDVLGKDKICTVSIMFNEHIVT
jgi:hypothetical protein